MERIAYIGGFLEPEPHETLRAALIEGFGIKELEAMTFAQAMKYPERVRARAEGALAITHSAGFMALVQSGAIPKRVIANNPPVPCSAAWLATVATTKKTLGMFTRGYRNHGTRGLQQAAQYNARSFGELMRHPVGNLQYIRAISRFDTTTTNNLNAILVLTEQDAYFHAARFGQARKLGIPTILLAGEHDELLLRPAEYIAALSTELVHRQ
ncbi:MAG: hypothetical protein Q4B05_00820 [Candidatus Saccharibacteria bacterium]|nr:hypothetical protein [Candidatus Saccharibacteria bacterium]